MSRGPLPHHRIICLEGPSAAGKTTLARALEASLGAAVIPELDAAGAPPPERAEPWFSDRHAEQWCQARALRAGSPVVVIDGDPLKGLWYNWMHADEGWPGVDVVGTLCAERIQAGTLGFPDLYVYLDATEAQLRARRAGDPTRRRRGFEKHVRTLVAQRRYFAALSEAAPGRVAFLDTGDRTSLTSRAHALVAALPAERPESLRILEAMTRWLGEHRP